MDSLAIHTDAITAPQTLFGRTSANRRLAAVDIDVKNFDIDVRNVLTQNSLFAFGTPKLVRDARL